jgi:metallo-beta-lactamase family protein
VKDAERALQLFQAKEYHEPFHVGKGVTATFRNAGHILGSAVVQLDTQQPEGVARLVFSGDLGRYHQPLHTDPEDLPPCEALILESTYGDRDHNHEPLAAQIQRAFAGVIQRKGTILIPSFAVARAQLVTLILRELIETGRLPEIPIHVDSPMASDVTGIYNRYLESEYLDRDIPHTTPRTLFPRNVRFHRSVEDSKKLNNMPGPRIIISASGMLTGGRVLHHLQRLASDRRNLIALVGYQAEGTRGRALLEGARTIRMYGMDIPIHAEVTTLNGLSAHADRDELLRWVGTAPTPPRTVFLTHGEQGSAEALAEQVRKRFGARTEVPAIGEEFDLTYLLRS